MAEKTKAEILEEVHTLEDRIQELESENQDLNKKLDESTYAQDANYQHEIQRLAKKSEKLESELKSTKDRIRDEAIERETIANDKAAAEQRRLEEFGISNINQSEFTRFRVLPKPPAGQRDITGDPTSEVFDLGVDFQFYNGGLYVPVPFVIEMGQSIGMLTEEKSTELKAELAATKAKVESAGSIAQELIDGISSRVDKFYSDLSSVVVVSPDNVPNAESNDSNDGEASHVYVGSQSPRVPADSESDSEPTLFGNLK